METQRWESGWGARKSFKEGITFDQDINGVGSHPGTEWKYELSGWHAQEPVSNG